MERRTFRTSVAIYVDTIVRAMILIKLGGSVITDKSQYKKFNEEQAARLCREIAESGRQCIVVHGAGSFGHVLAKKYRIQDGFREGEQIAAAAEVHHDAMELGMLMTSELMKAGIPAASVAPGNCFVLENGRLIVTDDEAVRRMQTIGIMPVTFGDVVMDRVKGFAIVSGDQMMEYMAKVFEPERIVFVSDIDGLYTKNPKLHPDAELIPVVTEETMRSVGTEEDVADVTGGVRNKMEAMLRMCAPGRDCILVNGTVPGRLLALLEGKDVPCTAARL